MVRNEKSTQERREKKERLKRGGAGREKERERERQKKREKEREASSERGVERGMLHSGLGDSDVNRAPDGPVTPL